MAFIQVYNNLPKQLTSRSMGASESILSSEYSVDAFPDPALPFAVCPGHSRASHAPVSVFLYSQTHSNYAALNALKVSISDCRDIKL